MAQNDNQSTEFAITGLLYVHKALRRDVELFQNKVETISMLSENEIGNIHIWFKYFVKMILEHHASEEKIFFKELLKYDKNILDLVQRLDREHGALDNIIDEIDIILGELAKDKVITLVNRIDRLSVKLRDHVVRHANLEEREFIPFIEKHIPYNDQKRIEKKIRKHVKMKNLSYLIPWMGSALDEEEQYDFYKNLPFIVRILNNTFWQKKYYRILGFIQ